MSGVFCGRHDPDLIPQAVTAARRTARHPALAGADLVVSSPAGRAHATAVELVGDGPPPLVDERLQEIDFGAWDGLMPSQVAELPEYLSWLDDPAHHAPPGGETASAARDRLVEAVDEHLRAAQRLVLVSHKGSIRLIVSHYTGLPIAAYRRIAPVPACSVTVIRLDGGEGELISLGDTSHLGPRLTLGAY
jgi:alpha-ribazole phosphatase